MAADHEIIVIDDSDNSPILIEIDTDEDESIFQEDWDNYKRPNHSDTQIVISDFFLIMEINRFVPYMEGSNIKFHPMNMPYIKIGKIDVIGFVTDVKESLNNIEMLVEDGTGALRITYERNQYNKDCEKRKQILNKYQAYAKNINNMTFDKSVIYPKTLHTVRPGLSYHEQTAVQQIAMLEHKWWLETNKGLLGKQIVRTDYIKATGYCHLDFQFQYSSRSSTEITFDNLCKAKPIFTATKLQCIEEVDYNNQIRKWLSISAKRRYNISQKMT